MERPTCVLAYAVGTALDNFPLASVVISGVITTLLLGVIFWRVRRQRQAKKADRDMDVSVAGGGARSDGGLPASGPPAELGARTRTMGRSRTGVRSGLPS